MRFLLLSVRYSVLHHNGVWGNPIGSVYFAMIRALFDCTFLDKFVFNGILITVYHSNSTSATVAPSSAKEQF